MTKVMNQRFRKRNREQQHWNSNGNSACDLMAKLKMSLRLSDVTLGNCFQIMLTEWM